MTPTLAAQIEALAAEIKTSPISSKYWDLVDLALNNAPAIVTALRQAEAAPGVVEAALNQNDAMRQELAHVGNLVSDLARAMQVDQANDDGTWANLAGRVQKLTRAALARQHGAREDELAWLAERDNLVLVHSTRDEAWQVRRASSGEVRGQGNTPRAALQAAMIPAAPATDVGEGPAYEYGYTWGPEEGPGDTDVHVPAAPEANPGEVK